MNLVRSTSLSGYSKLVHELGGDPKEFLSRFGIPLDAECQWDAFIPFEALLGLFETSAAELECPEFGLRLSRLRGAEISGPVAAIVRNSATTLEATQAAARFMYVYTSALDFVIQRTDAYVRVVYEPKVSLSFYPRQAYEASLGFVARFNRLLIGADASIEVSLMHAQLGSDAAYRDAMACPVRFEQNWCGYEMPIEVASMRIPDADPETRRIVTKYLESTYLPATASMSERVAEQARQLLSTGLCSVDAIANQLAIHPRTLQRRLAVEGLSCQDVIDSERRIMAERYLNVPGLQLGQVAGLVGYTEQSALNRSCRRWFGMTPREYRTAHLR
jgi:AraC-like DNA-binding protein